MDDGMDWHRKVMRTERLKDLSNRRVKLLRDMATCLDSEKDVAPLAIETEALLAIGRSESTFQYRIAEAKYAAWKREFNKQPWWQRVWAAWKKIPVGLIADSCESALK